MIEMLEALTVRPGDTFIVRIASASVTRGEVDQFKAEIEKRLPGVSVLFVAAEQLAVYRPEPAAKPRELSPGRTTLCGYAAGQERPPTRGQFEGAKEYLKHAQIRPVPVEGCELAREILDRYATTEAVAP